MVRFASGLGVSVSVALGDTGSVGLDTVAVLTRLLASEEIVLTTSVNTCGAEPAASVPISAVIVPLAPTAVALLGALPICAISDTKAVPAGNGSLSTTLCASE